MNRRLLTSLVLLVLVAAGLVSSAPAVQQPSARPGAAAGAATAPPLLFVGDKHLVPLVYLDGGTPSGLAVDLVRAIGEHLSRPVEIRAIDWPEAQTLVLQGHADALMPMNPTAERRKIYDFSEPFLESYFSIYAHSRTTGISGMSSLRGLRVGVVPGGLPRVLLSKDPRIHLVTVRDYPDGFNRLGKGEIDAVVADYRVGPYVLAQSGIRNVEVTGEPIQWVHSTIAVRKGNTQLLGEINRALRIIKANGTYQRILNDWAPTEAVFVTQAQINERLYRTIAFTLLALLLIATTWILTIRRQLNRRKVTEEQSRRQYSTLRSIIDSINAPIFSLDRRYRYTSFNQRHLTTMKTLYGTQTELGHIALESFTVPKDREALKRDFERALAGERLVQEVSSGEEPHSRRYFQVSHNPVETEAGDVIGVAVLAQDITERRRIEDEIRRLNRELEQRVIDRTAQLEASNKDLEAFAYSISHDLRAPLRQIHGIAGILNEDYGPQLDDEARRLLARVASRSERMGQLIEDLLSFSRMGRQRLFSEQVDLGVLVREVIREADPELGERDVRWQIAPLPVVTGDRAMLRVVLTNLVSNALKFTRPRAEVVIDIGVREQPDAWVFFVRDNGVGFNFQFADKLFGVFERLHGEAEFEGTGIGLANVRQIIERHGGQTWAEGEVDHGATVYFSLPRAAPPGG